MTVSINGTWTGSTGAVALQRHDTLADADALSELAVVTATGLTIAPIYRSALNESGTVSIAVPAADPDDPNPLAKLYRVTTKIDGTTEVFNIAVTTDDDTIDLATATHVSVPSVLYNDTSAASAGQVWTVGTPGEPATWADLPADEDAPVGGAFLTPDAGVVTVPSPGTADIYWVVYETGLSLVLPDPTTSRVIRVAFIDAGDGLGAVALPDNAVPLGSPDTSGGGYVWEFSPAPAGIGFGWGAIAFPAA